MKINHLFLLCFFIPVLILISCNNSNQVNQEKNGLTDSTSAVNFQNSLKEINRQIEDAIYKGDYETLLKYYADDVIIVPNFQPVLYGKDAVRESYNKQEKEGIKINSFHAKTDKIWADKINIYEYGSYGLSFSSNVTKHPYGVTDSYFMIWEKQKNNSYLVKYFISNLDFNPCKDYL
ncbi:MAG: DUF4440 domain-containing protein [Ignavibacteriaceae bacterium]